MTERRGGLGRGLAALIPSGPDGQGQAGPRLTSAAADVVLGGTAAAPVATPREDDLATGGAVYRELPTGQVRPNPRQPRHVFDDEALAELVHSIREIGRAHV